jgi:GNAT superfamily N-acetyltransferase
MDDVLTNPTDEHLARAVEANGVECCLSWAAWPGMERRDHEYLTWTMTDVPFPFFNNAFYPNMPEYAVDAVVEDVIGHARRRNVPLFFWTGPTSRPRDFGARLIAKGCRHGFEAPAMAVRLDRLRPGLHQPPSDFRIQEVTDEALLAQWCRVMAAVYEFPDFAAHTFRAILAHLGLGTDRPFRHFLGCLDDQPVATASLFLHSGVAGLSSVGTLPDFRYQGLGTAITLTPLQEAHRLGYRYGVLFSSPMGLGIYKSIGFQQYATGRCYLWPNV